MAGEGVDAAGDGLGFFEALVAKPGGDGERASAMMAEDEDGRFFVQLFEGASGDFVHGDEGGVGDVGGVVFPLLADVEEEWGFGLGEELLELVYGDFEIHVEKNTRCNACQKRNGRQRLLASVLEAIGLIYYRRSLGLSLLLK